MKIQIVLSILGFWIASFAAIVHVPNEYTTIQQGISAAQIGDTVLVADNIYYENINFMGKAITVSSYFVLDRDSTHIYNTIIDGRDNKSPDVGSTVSFNMGEDTTSVLIGFTITNGTGTQVGTEFRGGGGIFAYEAHPKICHNRIINNTVENSGDEIVLGGGIYAAPFSRKRIIIRDNTIAHNIVNSKAGGNILGAGIYFATDAIIERNKIIDNQLVHEGADPNKKCFGAGISSYPVKSLTCAIIRQNKIRYNKIFSQGCGYGAGVDLIFTNSHFSDNDITGNSIDAGNYACGTGMRFLYSDSSSTVQNNNFVDNNSNSSMPSLGAGLLAIYADSLEIINNFFIHNSGKMGGGIYVEKSIDVRICGNLLYDNHVTLYGGGLYVERANPMMANNIISKNTALIGGGVFFNETLGSMNELMSNANVDAIFSKITDSFLAITPQDHITARTLADTYDENISLTQLSNNTIIDNSATRDAGGIRAYRSDIVIFNCILWGNSNDKTNELCIWGKTVAVAHSVVQGARENVFITDGGSALWMSGNLSIDPLIIPGCFLPDKNSACIGCGANSIIVNNNSYDILTCDYYGNERPHPVDKFVDIGACETSYTRTHVKDFTNVFPSVKLAQNQPNPFNPTTRIEFSLSKEQFVTVVIYNLLGEIIETPVSENLGQGIHTYTWNACNQPSGVYFYHLQGEQFSQIRKMLLVR